MENQNKKETVDDLKKGDKIYDFDDKRVKWYIYLCIHPRNNKYHILIDDLEDPFRIYQDNLQRILDKKLKSYRDARHALADDIERRVKFLRKDT